jgi:predicted RNA binding protein YcfA (HicA-like mRNA interferase family)
MPSPPLLRPREVIHAFKNLGWEISRQKGSHIIMTKAGSMATLSIPEHLHVARGTLRSLIDKAGITLEAFLDAANR